MTTEISIAIQNALQLENADNIKSYWAGIYLSVLESLVFQNNTAIGFHQLLKKELPLTLASLKANSNMSTLNALLSTTYKNHSFEYIIRNMFNTYKYQTLFFNLIDKLCEENDCDSRSPLYCKYFILGKDSVTQHPEIDRFDFRVKTKDGWISDKSKIKEYMQHCDAAIQVSYYEEKIKVLFLGEIEGKHGDKLLRPSFWINDKKGLAENRCFHFGIGVTPTPDDLKITENLPRQKVSQTLVPVGKNNVVVNTFEQVTDLPSDVYYALEDMKKKFNDNEFNKPNSLFSDIFYNSIKIVLDLINEYWNKNIMELLIELRKLIDNWPNNLDVTIEVINDGRELLSSKSLVYTIPPLAGSDVFIRQAKSIEKHVIETKKVTPGDSNISISSVFTGNFLLPRRKRITKP
ncbi:hypothetical protein ACVLVH_004532 [Kluyvera sp. 1366]